MATIGWKRVVPAALVVLVAGACAGSSKAKVSVATTAAGATTTTGGLRPGGPGGSSGPGGPGAPDHGPTTTGPALTRPRALVAVTTAGSVQALDPTTGQVLHTLASGATGDEIGMTPDGATVFYETPVGCTHQINSVANPGGATKLVAAGSYPTVSPDGTLLAYARQPNITAAGPSCQGSDVTAAGFAVVVRTLATGAETRFGLPPTVIANGLPLPIDHLSWAPDNRRLAVSIGGGQDNEQWSVLVIDRTRDKYYVPTASPAVPVSGAKGNYYREAVFTGPADLFVDRECCTGIPPHVTASVMTTIDAVTGATRQQVAVGTANRDHTSLDVDGTGHWLLYLSGVDLLVSQLGGRPTTLASGFQAADW